MMKSTIVTLAVLCLSITMSFAREQVETSTLPRSIINNTPSENNISKTIAIITDVVAHSSSSSSNFEYLIYGWAHIPSDYENLPNEKVSICIDNQYYTTTGTRRYSELNDDFCPACRSGIYTTINSSDIVSGPHEVSLYWKNGSNPGLNDICTSFFGIENKLYSEFHDFIPDTIDMSDPNINRVVVGSNDNECNSSDPVYDCNGTVLLGLDGDDLLIGLNGHDRPVWGEDGDDVLLGIKGDDVLKSGNGNDRLLGGAGNDRLRPEAGIDWLYGGFGDDSYKISADFGINYIVDPFSTYIGNPNDSEENPIVNSNLVQCISSVQDTGICYQSQNQTFVVFEDDGALILPDNLITEAILDDSTSLIGATDINSCLLEDDVCDSHFEPTDIVVFDLIKPIDCLGNSMCISNGNYSQKVCNSPSLHLSYNNDEIQLGVEDNFIDASSGDDLICAGAGNDVIIGGTGDDILFGQNGDDKLVGGSGDDVIYGGYGNDIYVYHFNDGHDTYNDSGGENKIYCLGAYGNFDPLNPNVFSFFEQAVDNHYDGSITVQTSGSATFSFYGCAK